MLTFFLEIKLAEFHVEVVGVWSEDGTTTFFNNEAQEMDEEEAQEEGEEEGEGKGKEGEEEEEEDDE